MHSLLFFRRPFHKSFQDKHGKVVFLFDAVGSATGLIRHDALASIRHEASPCPDFYKSALYRWHRDLATSYHSRNMSYKQSTLIALGLCCLPEINNHAAH